MFKKNLFIPGKWDYVRGKKPKVECILCSAMKKDKRVDNLIVFKSDSCVVSLNLYPYNPGHLILFPKRHCTKYREITMKEHTDMTKTIKKCMNVIDEIYNPSGYNVGCNVGEHSGQSIEHFHYHIVPRFKNELGFIDIIGKSKIIVDNPKKSIKKIKKTFKKYE